MHDEILIFGLSTGMAGDPDLLRTVRRVLEDADLPASQLLLEFPARSLLADGYEAHENAQLLAELTCPIGLRDFTASAPEIGLLGQLRVHTVRLAGRTSKPDDMTTAVLTTALDVLRTAGHLVLVDSVTSDQQAMWWQELGAHAFASQTSTTSWPLQTGHRAQFRDTDE